MTSSFKFALCLGLVSVLPEAKAAENVSKSDVLAAIHAAEASRGHAFPEDACGNSLQLGTTTANSGASGLIVTEIKFDSGLRQARFLLRSRANRKAPPFYAWCGYPADNAREPSPSPKSSALTAVTENDSLGPLLVDVHRSAQLYLHSQDSAAVLRVKPLQSGRKDDRIRVRLPLHGKMIEALVVGQDSLDAAF